MTDERGDHPVPTPSAPVPTTANGAVVTLFLGVGLTAVVVLNALADEPNWALTAPGAVIVGVLWFFSTNALRGRLRTAFARSLSGRALWMSALATETAAAVAIMWLLLWCTRIGSSLDVLIAALAGTAAAFALDRIVFRAFGAR